VALQSLKIIKKIEFKNCKKMFFSEQRERGFSSGDGFSCEATSDDVWAGAGSLLTGIEARRQHESSKS
jgi:hypothetical protein